VRALLVGTTKAITGLHTTSKQLDLSALGMRDSLLREHALLRAQQRHLETQMATLAQRLVDAEAQHEIALREAVVQYAAAEERHAEAEVRSAVRSLSLSYTFHSPPFPSPCLALWCLPAASPSLPLSLSPSLPFSLAPSLPRSLSSSLPRSLSPNPPSCILGSGASQGAARG
jgi:hypothetical protein